MSGIVSAVRANMASLGWGNGLLYTIDRAFSALTGRRCRVFKYYLVVQPVPAQALSALPRSSRTRVYRASSTDDIIRGMPRPAEVIARRFRDGAVCFAAENAGNLVGFIWISLDRYDEDEVRCEYVLAPKGEVAWDFDAYVAPKFRMSRVFVQLWEAANEYLRLHGYHWTASRISAFNPASLATHRRFGAEHRHTAVFLVIGPLQLTLLTLAPFVHLSAGQAGRPRLVLRAPQPICSKSEES
jgi:GNAT superfamily N-acetyltransferase